MKMGYAVVIRLGNQWCDRDGIFGIVDNSSGGDVFPLRLHILCYAVGRNDSPCISVSCHNKNKCPLITPFQGKINAIFTFLQDLEVCDETIRKNFLKNRFFYIYRILSLACFHRLWECLRLPSWVLPLVSHSV